MSDLERAAMNGEPMPERLSASEQCAFQALSFLYHRFRSKAIDREAGHREKLMILRELRMRKQEEAFSDKVTTHRVNVIRAMEGAISAYMKAPSISAADQMVKAFLGVKR